MAIEMADVIIFLTDIKQGITAADEEIALMLKKSNKPVVLVCNKADNYEKAKEDSSIRWFCCPANCYQES